nr:LOB domain-containing protein 22 [Tanacetum cinerariifolium]
MTTQNNHPNTPNQPPPRRGPSNPPCAACRHIRKKCAPDCIFAPYFPENRKEQFKNANKWFGVSFMTRTLGYLNDREHKDDAMASIMYEADARARDPVGGCSRIVLELVQQLREAEDELKFVKQLVEFHKSVGTYCEE